MKTIIDIFFWWYDGGWRGLTVVLLNIFLAVYWSNHPYLWWWFGVVAANLISYAWLIFQTLRPRES